MEIENKPDQGPPSGITPLTVDTDIHAHMLATYSALRLMIVLVTFSLLITLSMYRSSHQDVIVRESISAYYHHNNVGVRMSDLFVACLASVGLLLLVYQGYTDRENWSLNIAGIAIICVVGFPMDWNSIDDTAGEMTWRGYAHFTSAIIFFFALGYVGLVRAHDTLGVFPDGPKKTLFKNLYRITGFFMGSLPFIAGALILSKFVGWVYAIEFFGVSVFIIYWVVKSVELRLMEVETREGIRAVAARAVGPKGGGNLKK